MVTPEDIKRLYTPPTETYEQLLLTRVNLDQQMRAMDPSDPNIEGLKMDDRLLAAHLSLTNDQIAEIREQAGLLNSDLLGKIVEKSERYRFVRLTSDLLVLPYSSKFTHAQNSVSVFGLRRVDDAGFFAVENQNALRVSGGSSTFGIRGANPQRPLTVSLIESIGKIRNPAFVVRTLLEQ